MALTTISPDKRKPTLQQRQHLKMAESAHAYVRGNTARFYEWLKSKDVQAVLPQGPNIWICGDCHTGNLGPVSDLEGHIDIQIRDLDQTVIGNPAHDLLRLGLSLAMAARSSDLPGVTTALMLEEMIDGYLAGLTGRTERIDLNKVEPIRKVLVQAKTRQWRHLAEERIEDVKPTIPLGKKFWTITEEERAELEALVKSDGFNQLLQTIGGKEPKHVKLLDAAYWMKGCSSLCFVTPVTRTGSIYLFCLFLSHAYDRTILSKKDAPKVTNRERDLFQACATIAAGGYVRGPSKSFGWPRPDGSEYLKALKRIYTLFGDGTPHKKARPAAAKAVKDNGIDVIAWRRPADNLPGTLYLVGQVASGKDWKDKSVVTDRAHFHKMWFERQPGSQPTDAMFMPFGLEPDIPADGTPYTNVLIDHMQSVAYKFGQLFYRDRVARHFGEGINLVDAGEAEIERYSDVPKILRWVNTYSKRLRTA